MTQVLAIYAAVVSTGSLVVAISAYWAGGPRVTIRADTWSHLEMENPLAQVDIRNRGRGAVTILSCWAMVVGDKWSFTVQVPDVGPELPYRLDGHSGTSFGFEVHWPYPRLATLSDYDGDPIPGTATASFHFVAELGNGHSIKTEFGGLAGRRRTRYEDLSTLDALRRQLRQGLEYIRLEWEERPVDGASAGDEI